MAATALSYLKLARPSLKVESPFVVRHTIAFLNRNNHNSESGHSRISINTGFGSYKSTVHEGKFGFGYRFTRFGGPMIGAVYGGTSHMMHFRTYSSSPDGNLSAPTSSGDGVPWMDKVKDAWNSTVAYTGEKAKEVSEEVTPHAQKLLDTYPYLNDVVVPVGGTLIATLLAWFVLPKFLRKLHTYSEQGASRLYGSSLWGPVPFAKSFWGAMEDPIRYLITFMAFMQISIMIAPTTIATQYIGPVWKGAVIVSFVWFLNRWKTNAITRVLENMVGAERNKWMTVDKVSSVSLFVLASMALAEACGVPVQSILTVGGVGGVATAFAARDMLGNILSGLSVQISQPFAVGDTIKAGSVEGQVVSVGLISTSLLTTENFRAVVPNSFFSNQVIVNKSRAQMRSMATTIPLQTDEFDKIPSISDNIKKMLKENPDVFLGKEAPYCFLSRVEQSFAELSIGCNLKLGSKEQLFKAQEDILLKSIDIIRQHGVKVNSFL